MLGFKSFNSVFYTGWGFARVCRPRYATIRLVCRAADFDRLILIASCNSKHVRVCERSRYKDKESLSWYFKHIFSSPKPKAHKVS